MYLLCYASEVSKKAFYKWMFQLDMRFLVIEIIGFMFAALHFSCVENAKASPNVHLHWFHELHTTYLNSQYSLELNFSFFSFASFFFALFFSGMGKGRVGF